MTVPLVAAGPRRSRADLAVARLVAIAESAPPGERLGSKDELRATCSVSVGTFNEAVRVVQARGLITVRPGPGGGLFAATQSPFVRLGNSVLALDGAHGAQTSVAEAVRIRDALDPLMIEDALWHASPADIEPMRTQVARMQNAMTAGDPVEFVRANWDLHAAIAAVSPNVMLRSLYTNLLDLIESRTLTVLPGEQPLPEYLEVRYRLHRDLVAAIAARERDRALELIHQHVTSPR